MGIKQTCKSQLISLRENGTKLLAFRIELMSKGKTYSKQFVIVYWGTKFEMLPPCNPTKANKITNIKNNKILVF
jgi:hypothetical protein